MQVLNSWLPRSRAFPRFLGKVALVALLTLDAKSTVQCQSVTDATAKQRRRAEDAFISGLCGDALALGGHYEYDAAKIKDRVGEYTSYHDPGKDNNGIGWGTANYHPGKKAGDLTDAGDVAIMLLEHLVDTKGVYQFNAFAGHWLQRIANGYGSCNFQTVGRSGDCKPGTQPGYINGGSRRTLQVLSAGDGSFRQVTGDERKRAAADINCLMAATHFLPLFLAMDLSNENALVEACVSTVYLSHKNRDPLKAAEFLARALQRIIHLDMPLEEALNAAAQATGDNFINARLRDAKQKVLESQNPASELSKAAFVDDVALTSMARLWEVGKTEPIKVGKASPTEGALPGALYLTLKYKDSLRDALVANANIGGDSAARGIVVGMLLGAVHSRAALPKEWLTGLNELLRVEKLMRALDKENNIKEL